MSRPQSGRDKADVVFEEIVEGGVSADQPFAGAGATKAVSMTTTAGRTAVVFNYDAASKTWRRSGLVEGGGAVAPANVIVQLTRCDGTDKTDLTGATVEKAVTVSSGEALILAGGMVVRGRWSKPSAGAFTTYTDSTGAPIRLLPGRTWVALPRTGTRVTTR